MRAPWRWASACWSCCFAARKSPAPTIGRPGGAGGQPKGPRSTLGPFGGGLPLPGARPASGVPQRGEPEMSTTQPRNSRAAGLPARRDAHASRRAFVAGSAAFGWRAWRSRDQCRGPVLWLAGRLPDPRWGAVPAPARRGAARPRRPCTESNARGLKAGSPSAHAVTIDARSARGAALGPGPRPGARRTRFHHVARPGTAGARPTQTKAR